MLERSGPVLKLACLGLVALVVWHLGVVVIRKDPLASLAVPSMLTVSPISQPSGQSATNTVPRSSLSPAAQARIDRITQSELLAPVVRPPPMALLGIAGPDVFLRGPSGQTGLLREGESLGEIKLLQIGTNRVLIEHEGQSKELTIFSGFGSETLLPKEKAMLP